MLFLLAGTSDARELAVALQAQGYTLVASVVTETAATSLRAANIAVRTGRLDQTAMAEVLTDLAATILIDASHPFAEEAHHTAVAAAAECGIPYLRYEREDGDAAKRPGVVAVDSYEQAAEVATHRKGSIMLTTGGKTLALFAKRLLGDPDIRLVVRLLPRPDNLLMCAEQGIEQKNIVAMQGPFSRELNAALFRHFGTTLVITKDSGERGAVDEKLQAAEALGIDVVLIRRPRLDGVWQVTTLVEVLQAVRFYLKEVDK